VQDRNVVGTVLGRAVELTVGIDLRIPAVSRDFIMKISRRIAPLPLSYNDIARNALRTLRFGKGQFAGGDAIRPVSEQLERSLGIKPGNIARHEHRSAAGLQALRPCSGGILECAEPFAERPGSGRAHRMTRLACATLHDIEPLALALDPL